jgi:predicted dehydrogenase
MNHELKSRREFVRNMALSGSAAFLTSSPWIRLWSRGDKNPAGAGDRVRLAVIGTGSRGTELINNLIPVLKDINVEISAICDNFPLHLSSALELCHKNGVNPIPYSDYRHLLEKEKHDGVIIAVPLTEHAHIAVDCMKAGIHVFCEKSMARTPDDVKRMYDTYCETGRILQIGHQRMFNPIYLKGIEKIRNGEIGQIGQMRGYWHRNNNWRRPLPGNDQSLEKKINWRLYKELSGGLLTELMSHQLHVANWALDKIPVSVMGTGSIVYWKDGRTVNDNVALIYSYDNGVKFIYDSMISNVKYGLEEQILGDKATLEFEVNRNYAEVPPPAPGIQHLINDIEHDIFDRITVAGSSWVPEIASRYKGEPIIEDPDFIDTQLELESFARFIREGSIPEKMVLDPYYTSMWALLGEQAIDMGLQVSMPAKYMVS